MSPIPPSIAGSSRISFSGYQLRTLKPRRALTNTIGYLSFGYVTYLVGTSLITIFANVEHLRKEHAILDQRRNLLIQLIDESRSKGELPPSKVTGFV